MHETTPTVYLIARTAVDSAAIRAYLEDVGGASWLERILEDEPKDAELLVEFAGVPAIAAGSRASTPT